MRLPVRYEITWAYTDDSGNRSLRRKAVFGPLDEAVEEARRRMQADNYLVGDTAKIENVKLWAVYEDMQEIDFA